MNTPRKMENQIKKNMAVGINITDQNTKKPKKLDRKLVIKKLPKMNLMLEMND